MRKSLKELSDKEFAKHFRDVKDTKEAKKFFVELFTNRSFTIDKNTDVKFRELASMVLPEILANTIKIKNADLLFKGEYSEAYIWNECQENVPYLVRKPNGDSPIGVVRFSKYVGKQGKMNKYGIKDYISFDIPNKLFKTTSSKIVKFDNEKMQMFSIVYKNHDEWKELDSDDEYMTCEDIRKAVLWVGENGMPAINIEHGENLEIKKSHARVVEFYQARTSWKEENLEIKKGDLVSTAQFYDKTLWDYTKEKFATYSLEGHADKVEG